MFIYLRNILLSFFLFSSVLWSANVGDVISNTATATYKVNAIDKNATSNQVQTIIAGTDATIEFLRADIHGGQNLLLGHSSYWNGIAWQIMSAPTLPNGTVLSTAVPTKMTEATTYNPVDLSLIKVTDLDQNIHGNSRDILDVNITSPSGDVETIRLIETGSNTGIFTGYLPLTDQNNILHDGKLYVQSGDNIVVDYVDNGAIIRQDNANIVQNTHLNVWISKLVNKDQAGVGEILFYTLEVHNDENFDIPNMLVDDHLPLGLKYKTGTAKIDGTKMTPRLSSDGKHVYFDLPNVPKHGEVKVTFIAQIGAGVHNHEVTNEAWAVLGTSFRSNRGYVTTQIIEELMRSKGIVVGQVYECSYDGNRKGHGVANVRLYTENGTYVVTDRSGQYHFEGMDAGTHVIQVDEDMLPDGYAMGDKVHNARFAGRRFSQFVNLGRGALRRVDFCLKRINKDVTENNESLKVEKYNYTIPTAVPEMPQYGKSQLQKYKGKTEILWPPENYVPSIPSTRIAIVHNKDQKAEVWLNDQKVSMLNYDGRETENNNTTVIDTYKGVDLLNKTNVIRVKIFDKQKHLLKTLKRTLRVTGVAVKVEYVKKNSYLVADGKHSPVIAVRFLDARGFPLRAGITGTFSIEPPYQSQVSLEQLKEDPLRQSSTQNRYTIHSDGIAYIRLQPTTKSGTASLHFKVGMIQRDEVIRAWLKPQLRKWIMVGFSEGTIGYNTLKGHQESLDAKGAKDKVVKEGRIAFFAKGRIKGDWLLTMAYDSGKDTKNAKLFDEIDPNTYYTLYNDGSVQNYEAASRKKLYVKIEKERFSAQFGDFSTDMTVTELAQYSRRMTGLKTEYHGEHFEGNAFVSQTEQLFMRDEIRGDGTSGFYKLKNKNILPNTEHVSIEVRNRYRNEIIVEKRVLQRFKDYEINYNRGTLYFKDPVYSTDDKFNPRYIIVNYEVSGDGSKHYTYGGRVAAKAFNEKVVVGVSHISEDTVQKRSKLNGIDTTIKIADNTVIKAEYAQTKTTQDGNTTRGDAKEISIEHVSEGLFLRTYYREQQDRFGLGQLNSSLGATRKIGIGASKTFDNRLSLNALAYRDTDLLLDKDQDVFEFRTQMDQTLWSAYVGYRYAKNTDTQMVQQILLGASYAFFDQRLKLSVTHDQSFGKNEDLLFPTKTTVGANFALTSSVDLFGSYEWAKGKENHELGRAGMRYRPWSGMTLENTTVSEFTNDTTRLYNTLGMLQTYQINENWSVNAGYERGELLDGNMSNESEPFNAYRLGVNFHAGMWSALVNAEYRDGQNDTKYNVTTGVYTQKSDDLAVALSAGYNKQNDINNTQIDANIRFSLAYRPEQTDWMILEKLDFVYANAKGSSISNQDDLITAKVINNLNLNYMPNENLEISLQHGIKYVDETIQEYEYRGVTQLFGLDTEYDFLDKWMVGAQASVLYAQSADNLDYGVGLYGGYNIFTNMMFTIGYNWEGFEDRDFSLQNYRIEGPYMQFKMKYDQENLKDVIRMLAW